jgi:outer membrane lipoprotein LolB
LAALLLSACAVTPRALNVTPWPQRLSALQTLPHFELDGRVAVHAADQGFSAGVRWAQQAADSRINLSAPLGFGGAQVELDGDGVSVLTSRGEHLQGEAARAQLRALLGFEPPLASLRYWVLGASNPRGAAEVSLDAQQRLQQLQQDGWQIDYGDYALTQGQWLPGRLNLTRDAVRLQLIVESWRL